MTIISDTDDNVYDDHFIRYIIKNGVDLILTVDQSEQSFLNAMKQSTNHSQSTINHTINESCEISRKKLNFKLDVKQAISVDILLFVTWI
jgi:hypothetical protein